MMKQASYLKNLTEMVYMTPDGAVSWQPAAALLSLDLHIPHLHLVLGHVGTEAKHSHCRQKRIC